MKSIAANTSLLYSRNLMIRGIISSAYARPKYRIDRRPARSVNYSTRPAASGNAPNKQNKGIHEKYSLQSQHSTFTACSRNYHSVLNLIRHHLINDPLDYFESCSQRRPDVEFTEPRKSILHLRGVGTSKWRGDWGLLSTTTTGRRVSSRQLSSLKPIKDGGIAFPIKSGNSGRTAVPQSLIICHRGLLLLERLHNSDQVQASNRDREI